jgi:hypothetical protein
MRQGSIAADMSVAHHLRERLLHRNHAIIAARENRGVKLRSSPLRISRRTPLVAIRISTAG